MNTTKRYIHPNEKHIREAMAKVWGGHSFRYSDEKGRRKGRLDLPVTDSIDKDLTGATRRDRTGDLLITKNIRRLQTLHLAPYGSACYQQLGEAALAQIATSDGPNRWGFGTVSATGEIRRVG